MAAHEKSDRLAEFVRRLGNAPAASDHDEALALITTTLNAVEDEMSGVPYDESRSFSDGRLYPPSADYEVESTVSDARCYRQRGHMTHISATGAIRISRTDGDIVFEKAGANGLRIEQ
jgi:hypothetical protein